MNLSFHPRFHACPIRTLLQLKALSSPFAQSETQPSTAFSVAGCATGLLTGAHFTRASFLASIWGSIHIRSSLYFDRSWRCARMPGGIHLRLLGRYERVAMCLNFLEFPQWELRRNRVWRSSHSGHSQKFAARNSHMAFADRYRVCRPRTGRVGSDGTQRLSVASSSSRASLCGLRIA
jgi:hypothetical protein